MSQDRDIEKLSASGMYKKMSTKRDDYLNRARTNSELTIPQLFPPQGASSSTQYPTPYQSLGARGVNNLANKIILSLFPPQQAFFKLQLPILETEKASIGEGEINTRIYALEKAIVDEMETSKLRPAMVEAIKKMIVGGSALLYVPTDTQESPRNIPMEQFVVRRSKSGDVLELVTEEEVSYLELKPEVQRQLTDLEEKELSGEKPLKVYTAVVRINTEDYAVFQEIKNQRIDGTDGVYKEEKLPFLFVPFVDRGEDYGRSYVEDYLGDLQSYEGLSQAILEGSSESARLLYLVRPNATVTPKQLQQAQSGDVMLGNPDDVGTIQANKSLDMSIAQQQAQQLKLDLATIFLLDSAVRRDAERVTAEEIRRVSQELEVALGGIYSTLSSFMQSPLVKLYINRMVKSGKMEQILEQEIELEVITGSAALGRGAEFNSLVQLSQALTSTIGPEAFNRHINVDEYIARMAYSLDINTGELIKTSEELAAEQQLQQQQQLEQNAIAPAINAAAQQEGE